MGYCSNPSTHHRLDEARASRDSNIIGIGKDRPQPIVITDEYENKAFAALLGHRQQQWKSGV